MATKSVTITCDAYERLVALKEPRESFSDVITKLTGRYSLLDLVGILSPKEAEKLTKSVAEGRERFRKQMQRTAAEWQ